ncbi:MAG: FliM/FliN family flagellar motor C-terminal domain-containing protein [Hyphomonadaceae bacterium]|nr:FliM/FliN family flagellar motor C-terminal domain-containing protein [Hyphomonadaceae bacterium]
MTLESVIAQWLDEIVGGENKVRLQSREVCRGKALPDDLFGAYLYGYESIADDFVVAVSIDNLIAARVAAAKMQQDPADLAEAPQLFLQLLLEGSAHQLSLAAATAFGMVNELGEGPEPIAFDALEVEGSCLLVYYLCDIEGQAVRIGIALKLEKAIALATGGDDGIASAETDEAPTSQSLSQSRVQNSNVRLEIILDRVPMSIAECARLEPGTVISLPGTSQTKLTVSAQTVDGPVDIAIGELGVWKHQRAVKLKTQIDPSFVQEVSAA